MREESSNVRSLRTRDLRLRRRCRAYLRFRVNHLRRQCPRGSNCNFIHALPKDEGIVCLRYLSRTCEFSERECAFLHLSEKTEPDVEINVVEENRQIATSLGKTLQYIKRTRGDVER